MANNDLEQTLWAAADKLRGHLDAAEYKHVVVATDTVLEQAELIAAE